MQTDSGASTPAKYRVPLSPLGRPAESPEEAVLALMMQVGRRFRTRQPDDKIDPASMPILHILQCSNGVRLTDLATKLRLDASTVSRHIRQLDDRGLVVRSADPDDRRATQVVITARGTDYLTDSVDRRLAALREVLVSWNDRDRDTLQKLLTKFAADLRTATESELETNR
jgi:DNA-binding MarR family transcriptional regulator